MEPIRGSRGFTLIEMLVVAAIIIVITGVIFSGRSQFNNSILLSSTSYDIALTMRDAETYGLGTRASAGIANAGYGLDFNINSPTSYAFFADTYPAAGGEGACHALPANGASAPNAYPGNCVYDPGTDALVTTYQLGAGITISDFCAYNGTWSCASTSGLTQLDVIFLRPNATPFFSVNGAYSANPAITEACLTISGPQNTSRYLSVSATGQIIANTASCP